jgi:hypothetical protein
MFAPPPVEPGRSMLWIWIAAGLVVLVVAGLVVLATRKPSSPGGAGGLRAADPYAGSLEISGIQMSESASLSAVKVTYIDGTIRNTGARTVSGATLQVVFGNDEQMPPQIETVPLTLIRTHEPYVDTEPVSAYPIKPGQTREFRLIFENIQENWNQQLPQIRVVRVD